MPSQLAGARSDSSSGVPIKARHRRCHFNFDVVGTVVRRLCFELLGHVTLSGAGGVCGGVVVVATKRGGACDPSFILNHTRVEQHHTAPLAPVVYWRSLCVHSNGMIILPYRDVLHAQL